MQEQRTDYMRRLSGLAPRLREHPDPEALPAPRCRQWTKEQAALRAAAGIVEASDAPQVGYLSPIEEHMRELAGLPKHVPPTDTRRVLVEHCEQPVRRILNESGAATPVRIVGTANTAAIKNGNGRTYSLTILKRAAEALNQKLRQGEAVVGNLDHPDGGVGKAKDSAVAWDRFWVEGHDLKAQGRLLNTVAGRDAQALLAGTKRLNLSVRGYGSVDANGNVSESDYQMLTCDIVDNSSCPTAFARRAQA